MIADYQQVNIINATDGLSSESIDEVRQGVAKFANVNGIPLPIDMYYARLDGKAMVHSAPWARANTSERMFALGVRL